MDFLTLQANIHKGIISPLYLLYGTETFLVEEIVHKIINSTLDDSEHDFNLSTFEMKEAPINVAIEEALTFPFMGTKKVVIIKDPIFLTAMKDSSKVDHNVKAFEAYIDQPIEETVFIVVAQYEKLDERKKIVKLLKKKAVVFEARPLTETEVVKWSIARAREYEVEITKEASLKLSELLGNRLMMISMELQKLSLYVGKDATITEVEVGQLVAKTVEQDVFTLIDCVIHKRKTEALETLYELLRKKEEPIKILSLLARQFRNIYQVNELIKRGYSQQKVASSLKLHPYAVKLAHQQGRLFEAKRLLSYIDQLADADYQIKSGKMDKQLVLELFFTKVLND